MGNDACCVNSPTPWIFYPIHPDAKLPTKEKGSVGWDITCVPDDKNGWTYDAEDLSSPLCVLRPMQRKLFSTGLSSSLLELDKHYILKPRSGLAYKKGIHVLAGVIDNSYNGMDDELMVLLINLGQEEVIIAAGDKICQAIVIKEVEVEPRWGVNNSNTSRGGFGSTGK